jgi:ubiquinone/menaquinone biosynthesis C-methylase UbiE
VDSKLRNAQHYNAIYQKVDAGGLVTKIRTLDAWLGDAIGTDTSWHGIYHDGFATHLSGKRVLEIGCGNGLNALVMAALGADVVANDIASACEAPINEAARQLGLGNISTISGDFAALSFPGKKFDIVVGKAFLHHLTHEVEDDYLRKIACLLTPTGEARFFEPATNSAMLDSIRWLVPVPGRPSVLQRHAFAEWAAADPHPQRDNSSRHFEDVGHRYFEDVQIVCIGSIERLCRLMPESEWRRAYRRWAHRMETRLPAAVRHRAARSQLIVYRQPRLLRGQISSVSN